MFQITDDSTASSQVFEELKKYNDQFDPKVGYRAVTFCARQEGEFLGGLDGNLAWDRFEISNMVAVTRNQGVGTALIHHLEEYCVKMNISKIYAWTLDFQAPGFYSRMGFETVCVIKDFAGPHSCHHFLKRL